MYDISIAVPTLNSEKYLENTLFCIVHQLGCIVEVIVADSGSVDETLTICKKYSIKTIFTPPGNMYSAVNKALAACESPWLSYLNSDDLVYPTSYAKLIRYGESQHADVVYGSCDYVDEEGRFLHSFSPGRPKELRSHFLKFEMSFAQPSSIFRKDVFRRLNGFNEQYQLLGDFDFYFRSILAGDKFAMLEGKSVCGYRISATQISRNRTQRNKEIVQAHQYYPRPTLMDLWPTWRWRIRNWPNYVIRLFRYKTMNSQFRFVRSTEVYGDER